MILTAKDIAQQLASKAEDLCRKLLPNGVKEGGNWCVGSVGGEAGHSLRVQLTGPNAGVWADFASSEFKGDLLGLIKAVKNTQIVDAIKYAKEWLGISDPSSVVGKKTYSPAKPKGVKVVTTDSPVFTYLCDERKIDYLTQSNFKISQSSHPDRGVEIVFPFISPTGECVNVKRIALKRTENGKKLCRQEPGCAPSLFGWQALPDDCREVILTEGEIDAMTWSQVGFPALSIPDGAKGDTWIEYEWENLQQFDTIWLNWDNDKEGQSAIKHFAKRLGMARCLVLTIPNFKDANEALKAGMSEADFASAVAAAKPITPEKLKTPSSFLDKVLEKFYPVDGMPPGFYPNTLDGMLGMRPGELTIWTGIAGHGKSALLNQLILEAIHNDCRCAIASMEMLGEQTLHRMICQAEQANKPMACQIEEILNWMGGKLWIFDVRGNVDSKELFDLMEYSCTRHGVEIFVIDSLMKCSVASDDYDSQRKFLNDLCAFAGDYRIHINLVAHARKGKDESEMPGKLDVLGSSAIINQADNLLCVWRNKAKEEKVYENPAIRQELNKDPDAIVFCTKQRETGEEFKIKYEYLKTIFRFKMMGKDLLNLTILPKLHPPQQEEDLVFENLGNHEQPMIPPQNETDPNIV